MCCRESLGILQKRSLGFKMEVTESCSFTSPPKRSDHPKNGFNHGAAKRQEVVSFLPAARPIHLAKLATRRASSRGTLEAPSMALLRVALLCQLFVSVAGAADKAVAIQCLTDEPGQVSLSFAGASATAFLKDIP